MTLNFEEIDSTNRANNNLYSKLASEFSKIISLKKPIYDKNNPKIKTKFLNYSKKRRMWFSRIIDTENFIYFFGYNYGKNSFKGIKPILILEFDKNGDYNKDSSGLFVKENGKTSILINPNYFKVHPIGKNIKTITSLDKIEYDNKEFYYIGPIDGNEFIENINRVCEEIESIDSDLNQKNRLNIKADIESEIAKRPEPQDKCVICGEDTKLDNIYENSYVLELRKNHMDKCINCINKIIAISAHMQIRKEYGNSFNVNDLRERFIDPEFVSYILNLFIKYQLSVKIKNNYILSNPKSDFKAYNSYIIKNILIEKENYKGKVKKTETPTIEIDKLGNGIKNEHHVVIDNVKRPTPHTKVKKPLKYINKRKRSRKKTISPKDVLISGRNRDIKTRKTNTHDRRKTISSKDVLTSRDTDNSKRCRVCGDKLPESSKDDKCKTCKKRYNAIRSLVKLLDSISIEDRFKTEDLNLKPIELKGIIWNLEDFDLIEHDNSTDEYQLKSRDTLKTFIDRYGEGDFTLKGINVEKTPTKRCRLCNKNLDLSKFSKNRKSADGYNEYCKDCHRKVRATRYLIDLLKFESLNNEFNKDSIDSKFGNGMILQSKLDTLVENNILKFDIEDESYKFNDYDFIYNFFKENARFENYYEEGIKELGNLDKDIEKTTDSPNQDIQEKNNELNLKKKDDSYLINGTCSEDQFYILINEIKNTNNNIKELRLKEDKDNFRIHLIVEDRLDLNELL